MGGGKKGGRKGQGGFFSPKHKIRVSGSIREIISFLKIRPPLFFRFCVGTRAWGVIKHLLPSFFAPAPSLFQKWVLHAIMYVCVCVFFCPGAKRRERREKKKTEKFSIKILLLLLRPFPIFLLSPLGEVARSTLKVSFNFHPWRRKEAGKRRKGRGERRGEYNFPRGGRTGERRRRSICCYVRMDRIFRTVFVFRVFT